MNNISYQFETKSLQQMFSALSALKLAGYPIRWNTSSLLDTAKDWFRDYHWLVFRPYCKSCSGNNCVSKRYATLTTLEDVLATIFPAEEPKPIKLSGGEGYITGDKVIIGELCFCRSDIEKMAQALQSA